MTPKFNSLAQSVVAKGQQLRAGESVSVATFVVSYAAKRLVR